MSLRTLVEAALAAVAGDVKGLYSTRMVPPIGMVQPSAGITGTGTATPTDGTQFWYPIDIGPTGWTADAVTFNLSTAYSATTPPTFFAGLYAHDYATGYPKTDTILAMGSLALSGLAAGVKVIPFAAAVQLAPGRYWLSALLAGTTGFTAGAITAQVGTAVPFPVTAGTVPGSNVRALKVAGLTSLRNSATAPTGFAVEGTTNAPIMNLRRSA